MSTEHADRPRDPAGDDEQLLEWILNQGTTAHPAQPAHPAHPTGHAALARDSPHGDLIPWRMALPAGSAVL